MRKSDHDLSYRSAPHRSAMIRVSFVFHPWLTRLKCKKMNTDHLISQAVQIAAARHLLLVGKNGPKKCALVLRPLEKCVKVLSSRSVDMCRFPESFANTFQSDPRSTFHHENARHMNQKLLPGQRVRGRRQESDVRNLSPRLPLNYPRRAVAPPYHRRLCGSELSSEAAEIYAKHDMGLVSPAYSSL